MSEVGYGKPPVEHQFKPGHAKVGGRKRKAKETAASSHVLDRMFTLTIEGKPTKVRAAEAVAVKQLQLALEGDPRAASLILKLDAGRTAAGISEATSPFTPPAFVFTTYDQSALEALGVLTREYSRPGESAKLQTWAARVALERVDEAFWEDPDVCKRAIHIADPMALLDLVPASLRGEWTQWAREPGTRSEPEEVDGD